ncbi:MAG TPA: metal ABC transporter permease [Stenomitos sp.]
MTEAFSLPFMQLALAASVIVALVASVLGVYVVLRRIVFVGAAVSQISAAGVALAFLTGLSPNPTAFVVTLLAVAGFAFVGSGRKLTQESILGLAYAAASAATILLIGHTAHGTDDIMNLLFGNILAVTPTDLALMGGAAVLVLGTHLICQRPFRFVFYDPEMAQTLGYNTKAWNLLFYVTLGIAIAAVTRVAGSLMTFAFLVIPAMTALSLAKGMRWIFGIAMGSAVLASVLGLVLSYQFDMPAGPAIVAVSAGLLVISAAISAVRGQVLRT